MNLISFLPFCRKGAKFSLLLLLAGCASNQPLISLPERPAPEADKIERPSWAQPVSSSPVASEPEEPEPVVVMEEEPAPSVVKEPEESVEEPQVDREDQEELVEEPKEEKKGFWSFLSRKKTSEEEEDNQPAEESEQEGDEDEEDAESVKVTSKDPEEKPEKEKEPELPRIDQAKGAYKLKSGDVLMIMLTGSGGLNEPIETVVDEEGAVKLRFIGAVKADGLTPTELEREIEAEYTDRQKIYKDVVARVVVPNRFYFIGREVRSPGRYPIVGKVSLSQAISAAGNFTEWANEKKIILVRGNERYEIDFREISKDPTKDILLQPGDSITVERRILF